MAHQLDLQTMDDGSVYLARKSDQRFVLAVKGGEGVETEVTLNRADLLIVIRSASRVLLEDEPV